MKQQLLLLPNEFLILIDLIEIPQKASHYSAFMSNLRWKSWVMETLCLFTAQLRVFMTIITSKFQRFFEVVKVGLLQMKL